MSDVSLVPFDRGRAVITGLELPSPPPTRISIGGTSYAIVSPRVPLPPLINTVKVILNWAQAGARQAKNVFYILKGAGSGSTSDPTWLGALAQSIFAAWNASGIMTHISTQWFLNSVTCRDNGGTSAVGVSTGTATPGSDSSTAMPPSVSVAISWQIADVYRGGKPRTYLPGITNAALVTVGSSAIQSTYATAVDAAATTFLTSVNTTPVTSTTVTLGSVSHFSGHALRPVPQFRVYIGVKVHERLDSQRRRNGPESAFPVTP